MIFLAGGRRLVRGWRRDLRSPTVNSKVDKDIGIDRPLNFTVTVTTDAAPVTSPIVPPFSSLSFYNDMAYMSGLGLQNGPQNCNNVDSFLYFG